MRARQNGNYKVLAIVPIFTMTKTKKIVLNSDVFNRQYRKHCLFSVIAFHLPRSLLLFRL